MPAERNTGAYFSINDRKPENIMLVPDPVSVGGHRAKILDFGIAKLMTEGGQRTRPDIVMGTDQDISDLATEEVVKNQLLLTAKRRPRVSERPWFVHV